jgi:hypothetical protein
MNHRSGRQGSNLRSLDPQDVGVGVCGQSPTEKTATRNPRILGPSLWLFANSAGYLRLSRLQTLVVRGC